MLVDSRDWTRAHCVKATWFIPRRELQSFSALHFTRKCLAIPSNQRHSTAGCHGKSPSFVSALEARCNARQGLSSPVLWTAAMLATASYSMQKWIRTQSPPRRRYVHASVENAACLIHLVGLIDDRECRTRCKRDLRRDATTPIEQRSLSSNPLKPLAAGRAFAV
jgi:hypothetical protein